MNSRTFRSLFLGAVLAVQPLVATDLTDPVGVFRIRLRGNSDTMVSLPLQRAPLVEAAIASRSGAALTLNADLPTVPAEGAFALVMSGALEGAVLPIANTSGRVVTVDAAGYDLSTLKTESVNGTTLADLVEVIPYWTLDTLFPQGQGVLASANSIERQTEVFFFDDSPAGTNFSAVATYYYFAGSSSRAAGWYLVGGALTAVGNTRVVPHRYFIVRHRIATDTTLQIFGGVQMAGFRLPLSVVTANQDQDNLVALPVAQPIALSASRLFESGAFRSSPDGLSRTDELMVFDNTRIAINKSATATYYYFVGSVSRAAGWYPVGSLTPANDVLLKPGEGYIIRKRNSPVAGKNVWSGLPTYLQ